MKYTILVLLLAMSVSASAGSLSGREKSFLYGVAGTVLVQKWHQYYHRSNESNVYVHRNYVAKDPIEAAYQAGVRERRAAELEEARRNAYKCGRYGTHCK